MPLDYKSPISAQLEVTQDCNNRCEYCYNFWRYEKPIAKKEMNKAEWKTAIDKLADSEIWYVNLTGGEPLMRKDKTNFLLKYLNQKDITPSMNTNLTLADKETVKKLKENGCKSILGSLTTYEEEKHCNITQNSNSFKKAKEGIENILREDIELAVNVTTFSKNYSDVYDVGKLISDLGVPILCTSRFMPSFANPEHLSLSLTPDQMKNAIYQQIQAKKDFGLEIKSILPIPYCVFDRDDEVFEHKGLLRSCAAGKSTFVVSSNGDIRPCIHMDIENGNILKEDINEIWNRMTDWRTKKYTPDDCKECKEIDSCKGGCRADPYARGAGLSGNDSLYKSKTDKINFKIAEKQPLKPESKINVRKIRKRKEAFGGIVSHSLFQIFPLNEDGMTFISLLEKNPDLRLGDLTSDMPEEKSRQIKKFIDYLYQGGIIDAS